MSKRLALGIDIGGTNTIYGSVDKSGNIFKHEEIPTRGSDPVDNLVQRLEDRVKAYIDENDIELVGIGVGAPNGNHFTGMIQDPPNLSWGTVDIVSILKDKFLCDVSLTNDANAAALGEKYYGSAKEMDDFIMITLGTGLGSGIFSGGHLLYGHDGFAGEMGHMPIESEGRHCNCGKQGCLESYVSASGVKLTIKEMLVQDPDNEFLNSLDIDKVDGLFIDNAFDQGDDTAKKLYQFTGKKLGQGLAQAANLLSPEAFIFYGGFSNAGDRLLNPTKKSMDSHLINGHADTIKLLQSSLPQGQAGILGAASLIWEPDSL